MSKKRQIAYKTCREWYGAGAPVVWGKSCKRGGKKLVKLPRLVGCTLDSTSGRNPNSCSEGFPQAGTREELSAWDVQDVDLVGRNMARRKNGFCAYGGGGYLSADYLRLRVRE
jgi:hypothetical protein